MAGLAPLSTAPRVTWRQDAAGRRIHSGRMHRRRAYSCTEILPTFVTLVPISAVGTHIESKCAFFNNGMRPSDVRVTPRVARSRRQFLIHKLRHRTLASIAPPTGTFRDL